MAALADESVEQFAALRTGSFLALPLEPALGSFGVALVPETPFVGFVPVGGGVSCRVREPSTRAATSAAVFKRESHVFARRDALQIVEPVVGWIGVAVVDVTVARDRAERPGPNIAMQLLAAARQIFLARPDAIEAAIEILRENVQDDWISEPGIRCSADVHSLAVLNR